MPFLSLVNPWVLLGVCVMLLACYVAGYWNGKDQSLDELSRREILVARVAEAAQRSAAAEIARIEVRHTTIKQKVQRETIENPVYRECVHSHDGLRLVNQALANGTDRPDDLELSRDIGGAAR